MAIFGNRHARLDDGPRTQSATIVLRRRAGGIPADVLTRALTSRELGECVGAHPEDVKTVCRAAAEAGLAVVAVHEPSRRIRIEGPEKTVRSWVERTPAGLAGVVTAVLGGRSPQASPRFRIARPSAVRTSYTPLQLADLYAMPDAGGSGQTIAIVELGGGFGPSDLDTYFAGLGLVTPVVRAVGVDGAQNQPEQDPNGADGEVLLDIEVAGAIAPKAIIVVYFAPNTDAGFLDAVSDAAHAQPTPTAISISWGESEDRWAAPARSAIDQACADASTMGVTVIAAAGDSGSSDSTASASAPHVDFPASSPHVLGCGGTTLLVDGNTVASETVWNDGGSGGATGGGVSDVFAMPAWQQSAGVPPRDGGGSGRGVPDVAAVADPNTGYQVQVDGRQMVIGGTSAVAPLWAGLMARIVQLSGRPAGLAQAALYTGVGPGQATPYARDVTSGSNGAYQAGPGWDPCTGLGVPDASTRSAFAAAPPSPSPPPSPPPSAGGSILDDLRDARTALDRAIAALQQGGGGGGN